MNEKQIEIALAKLRKVWKQTKTKVGKDRILFIAKTLKQGISGALIPLTMKNDYETVNREFNAEVFTNSTDAVDSGIQYFTPDFIRILQGK